MIDFFKEFIMWKRIRFKNLSPKMLVVSLLVLSLGFIGGVRLFQTKPGMSQVDSQTLYSYSELKSSKLKNFFGKYEKHPEMRGLLLKEIGPLSTDEINQGYNIAVKNFEYDLAIEFYLLGAIDCYRDGEDILLVAINSGRLGLVKDLLSSDYTLKLYHLNAVRSLVNIEQHNWAYIYKKQDTDDLGYQKYLIESQRLANTIITLYKEQNPIQFMRYDTFPTYQESYQAIFGNQAQEEFKQELDETLSGKYSFIEADHGTQHTPVLINEKGKKVGILKTKNEILAEKLDYDHFAGVPPAINVFIPEYGEVVVQKWVVDSYMGTEYKREKDWSPEQLHHIRVLDIRLGNSDRNKGNVLIAQRESRTHILPIDHDLLMHYIPNDTNWEASYLNSPFSPLSKKYVQELDLNKDAAVMENLGYSNQDILSMKIRTTLLKMSIEHNLTLKETDILFRFYYFDFLEKANDLTANASEKEIRNLFNAHMNHVSLIVQNPVEVWSLIGNNFELYI
ncbi:MAG: hypothetical protein S4CHLAM7_02440 [Chlamydiae bacterium]|nr:hypothetical protein [Chlamydiota bacterium]